MSQKVCTKCTHEHPIEFFNWKDKKKGRRSNVCKECTRKYGTSYYQDNTEIMKNNARRSNIRRITSNQELYYKYLLEHPCICGESDPVALDPDHQFDKQYDISVMIRNGHSWDNILLELQKCIIRCANCHRKKTAKEQSWRKIDLASPTGLAKSCDGGGRI